jgi:hypothetical protein
MDKKIVGVIGAISGLAALDSAAQATPTAQPTPDLMNARSFAELLDPIPNAVAALRASDAAARAAQEQAVGEVNGDVQLAGYHHHHRRFYHHHHHHHHRVIRRFLRHVIPHHHHHHHHHRY